MKPHETAAHHTQGPVTTTSSFPMDAAWMEARRTVDHTRAPLAAYEVHLGAFAKGDILQVLLFSLEFILINLVVDMLYTVINPTIRYKK